MKPFPFLLLKCVFIAYKRQYHKPNTLPCSLLLLSLLLPNPFFDMLKQFVFLFFIFYNTHSYVFPSGLIVLIAQLYWCYTHYYPKKTPFSKNINNTLLLLFLELWIFFRIVPLDILCVCVFVRRVVFFSPCLMVICMNGCVSVCENISCHFEINRTKITSTLFAVFFNSVLFAGSPFHFFF